VCVCVCVCVWISDLNGYGRNPVGLKLTAELLKD
jgi:hypothetical protein